MECGREESVEQEEWNGAEWSRGIEGGMQYEREKVWNRKSVEWGRVE